MIDELKKRKCLKCKTEKPEQFFAKTPSNFFPCHLSLICTPCLEKMIPQDNLGEVDRVCRYLDVPFDLNKWTQLYAIHKEHTFTAYFNTLLDDHYSSLQWADENERWRQARAENTLEDEIEVMGEARLRKLKKVWSSAYTPEQLMWLDNFYN